MNDMHNFCTFGTKWNRFCIMGILLPLVFLTACGRPASNPQTSQTPMGISTVSPVIITAHPTSVPTAAPVPTPTPAPTALPEGWTTLETGFVSRPLDEALKARITGLSYPKDDTHAEIHYEDLRYLSVLHYDFEGQVHTGELIVNKALAQEVLEIFYALYEQHYPMTSVLLVDEFGEAADDTISMEHNNTSAFNYRPVAGTSKLSLHSYGAAIDINPQLNPYVKKDGVSPANGAEYADRTRDFPGKIDREDLAYELFTARGWAWGGDFQTVKDYQHFSKDLGF